MIFRAAENNALVNSLSIERNYGGQRRLGANALSKLPKHMAIDSIDFERGLSEMLAT